MMNRQAYIHMPSICRRRFLNRALAGAAASMLPRVATAQDGAPDSPLRPWKVIDTNVSLFRWPFRRLPFDEADALVEKLRSLQIAQAWAGSYEGLFGRDMDEVNRRLAEACRDSGPEMLVPFGSINPELPDWEEDLRRCQEEHGMRGIRLHPNYHGYSLDNPHFVRLLAVAAERGLLVQLAAAMEDPRTQHSKARVPDVDLAPLPEAMKTIANAKVIVLNYRPHEEIFARLADVPGISFDIARVEDTHGVARLLDRVGPKRVVFGTHAPFLIYESALIKVYESDLEEDATRAVSAHNAAQLLSDRRRIVLPGFKRKPYSPRPENFGLPSAAQLKQYEIWDSYFLPSGGKAISEIERTLPTIEKGAIQRLCIFVHAGLGTADPATEERIRANPDAILEPLRRWPDRLLGMIYLNANDVRRSLDALNRWLRDGPMVGVYFPGGSAGSLNCSHRNFDPLVTRIAELGGVIMQHNWHKTGGKDHPGESTPADLAKLAARFPEQPFISAHAGGNWEIGINAVRDSPNILIETSGFDPTAGFIEMAVRELGAERIVFGTHLPSRSLGTELGKVIVAPVSEEDKRLILGANYRRLLGPVLRRKGLE